MDLHVRCPVSQRVHFLAIILHVLGVMNDDLFHPNDGMKMKQR